MLIPLILTVLWSLVVSFMCSVSEAVVLSVTHAQVEGLGRTRGAEILREFKREIDLPIAAIVSFHTVAHTVGASVCGAMYVSVFGEKTLWVFSLVFTMYWAAVCRPMNVPSAPASSVRTAVPTSA